VAPVVAVVVDAVVGPFAIVVVAIVVVARFASTGGPMKSALRSALLAAPLALSVIAADARAFCGFYVAQADSKLFNQASKVVMVRDGDRTILTMANDYQGSLKEFAVVVPVPQVITKDMVHAGDKKFIDRVDAWSAPRLVEYHDEDPCNRVRYERMKMMSEMPTASAARGGGAPSRDAALGVTIEAKYTVGEYDILVLSAKQSDGLATWLKENKYRIPDGAEDVLASYIKQNMKFFVAKVNLAEQDRLGFGYLRPLQVAYESPKFMLPIRLGTVNANGPQDLIVFALTRDGRVETTNYRNVKMPTGNNIPEYTKDVFGDFYKSMFQRQVDKENMKAVFLEHAWDMGWCDPCAADPLTPEELKGLGVWWLGDNDNQGAGPAVRRGRAWQGGAVEGVFLTRLHVRYDREHFPEDLVFQQTKDRENFQGRYVMQHAFKGEMKCEEATAYKQQVFERQKNEAKALAELTGWSLSDIEKKMELSSGPQKPADGKKWYQKLWGK
jgi:hypothetical protein